MIVNFHHAISMLLQERNILQKQKRRSSKDSQCIWCNFRSWNSKNHQWFIKILRKILFYISSVAEVSIATIAYLVDYCPESCNSVNKDGKTPEDLLKPAASYKDKAGRLLLHRLLATHNVHWMYTVDLTESVINFFADAYPNSITVQENNDMLPFHHACLSDWCMTNECLSCYDDTLIVLNPLQIWLVLYRNRRRKSLIEKSAYWTAAHWFRNAVKNLWRYRSYVD